MRGPVDHISHTRKSVQLCDLGLLLVPRIWPCGVPRIIGPSSYTLSMIRSYHSGIHPPIPYVQNTQFDL